VDFFLNTVYRIIGVGGLNGAISA